LVRPVSGAVPYLNLSPNHDGTWTESVIYSFCTVFDGIQCLDGGSSDASLVLDSKGNLYGTTSDGGSSSECGEGVGCGVVFELSPPLAPGGAWTETVLYSFCANGRCLDGALPISQLSFDGSGNLYGTTAGGGAVGAGTVFELAPSSGGWTLATLYSFCVEGNGKICPDGDQPQAGVTFDKLGKLYGTTLSGGRKNSEGGGTVYKLSPGASGWTYTLLVAFNPVAGAPALPTGTVSFDPIGNLYSTTSFNLGAVFELLAKTHTLRALVFGNNDPGPPMGGVVVDPRAKAAYGTGTFGGSNSVGGIFKISSSGQETVLYNFCQQANCADGSFPYAGLVKDASGNFYGTTSEGGSNNQGVVFEITP
jgi:uncharacterized repeat protein (TIGR03803 family)